MTIKIITVVKDDLLGLKRTERSISGQSKRVSWIVVTPDDGSVTFDYVKGLSRQGIVEEIILDTHVGIYPAMNQYQNELQSSGLSTHRADFTPRLS